jgi:hypothetical protein
MCGTASSLTAKFNIGAVPAFRLKQAFTRCPTNRQPVAHRNGIIPQRTTIVRQSLPVAPRIPCRQIWACLGSHRHVASGGTGIVAEAVRSWEGSGTASIASILALS